jgi:hypothetical protein
MVRLKTLFLNGLKRREAYREARDVKKTKLKTLPSKGVCNKAEQSINKPNPEGMTLL